MLFTRGRFAVQFYVGEGQAGIPLSLRGEAVSFTLNPALLRRFASQAERAEPVAAGLRDEGLRAEALAAVAAAYPENLAPAISGQSI